eukprot:scaffold326215_cov80-Tisochrysis_lutea.AAC.1
MCRARALALALCAHLESVARPQVTHYRRGRRDAVVQDQRSQEEDTPLHGIRRVAGGAHHLQIASRREDDVPLHHMVGHLIAQGAPRRRAKARGSARAVQPLREWMSAPLPREATPAVRRATRSPSATGRRRVAPQDGVHDCAAVTERAHAAIGRSESRAHTPRRRRLLCRQSARHTAHRACHVCVDRSQLSVWWGSDTAQARAQTDQA